MILILFSFSYRPIVSCLRTFNVSVTSSKVKFEFVSACFFYPLKYSVPIDWHYMTDRLQRVI